ncbi:phage-related CUP0950-like protein [Helicobacter acinonychis]|uniref:Phage-related CUP0950-like protein n=1 Tax=Helicobacter acinonychis (strain Sheeba) TaxID=382638 RepID=Q17VJ3_HELAH|nr:phage-related CUP0950-like protein [Helicobacter acinonychis]CAK00333.1 phage-related CUP0950-like protein [Helicobacter acinonychis str. Sheeba]
MAKEQALRELALRELARRDFFQFLRLKWERYENKPFLDNWHIRYLCKVLECTQPNTSAHGELIRRLIVNMPPSYGKTEIIARCFIAWSLGKDRSKKIFYISYSDELCRKIANQVRDLMDSFFYKSVFFDEPLEYLQNNAREFILREGGGLFVTTLKSALTGFHANQILIDDPIKVSGMSSKKEVQEVNANFKESVVSRLQDTRSNITILMQRLGNNDLCGFLQNEREFDQETIRKWKIIQLKALNTNKEFYQIKDFTHEREVGTPLFEAKHNKEQLEALRLQMGNDEFSAQYQQDPVVSSGGYFDPVYLKKVFLHELGAMNTYIFVDNALSLSQNADNRAIVVVGVENYHESVRYIVLDCFFGIWSEEDTIKHLLAAKEAYKDAKTFIESDGGGLVLHRLLLVALARHNQQNKEKNKELLNDAIVCYTPSRKISKVDKIKAMRPFYNTGFLVFSHSGNNTEQIEKELFSFNPDKPFKKDDCIDALASAITHESVKAPLKREEKPHLMRRYHKPTWRI